MEDGVLAGFEDLVHVIVECLKNFGIFCCGFGGVFEYESGGIIWRIVFETMDWINRINLDFPFGFFAGFF